MGESIAFSFSASLDSNVQILGASSPTIGSRLNSLLRNSMFVFRLVATESIFHQVQYGRSCASGCCSRIVQEPLLPAVGSASASRAAPRGCRAGTVKALRARAARLNFSTWALCPSFNRDAVQLAKGCAAVQHLHFLVAAHLPAPSHLTCGLRAPRSTARLTTYADLRATADKLVGDGRRRRDRMACSQGR